MKNQFPGLDENFRFQSKKGRGKAGPESRNQMSTATVTTIHPAVNPEQRKMIRRIRRIAKRHALRLVKDRRPLSGYGYNLQSAVVIANT